MTSITPIDKTIGTTNLVGFFLSVVKLKWTNKQNNLMSGKLNVILFLFDVLLIHDSGIEK